MASLPEFLTNTSQIHSFGAKLCHSELRYNIGWSLDKINEEADHAAWDLSNDLVLDALAREALLQHCLGKFQSSDWPAVIANAHPIHGCRDTLSVLIQEPWAPALFPIDHGNNCAETGIVWRSHQRRIIEPSDVSGDSWKLADALASFALTKAKKKETIRRLALEFIASGRIIDGAVCAVNQGCKSELKFPDRIWLVPSVGWSSDGDTISVGTLDDACAIIADELTLNEEDKEPWPDSVADYHSFVGKAVMPIVEAILCARPDTVHLWISEWVESRPNAELIKRFFESTLPEPFENYTPNFVSHPVVSNNISAIEQQLRIVLLMDGDSASTVFNITTGNRLQSIAALNMMRLLRHEKGFLVYKDIDHKVLGELAIIRHDTHGTCARTGLLTAGDRFSNFSQEVFSKFGFTTNTLEKFAK